MVTIIAVACPVCGAPMQETADSCAYCGSLLVIHVDSTPLTRPNLERSIIRDQIAALRTRARIDPHDIDARFGLALAYLNLGLIEDASDELEAIARLEPENSQLQSQAAVVLRERFVRGDGSVRHRLKSRIEAALRLDPDDVDALTIQAELLANDGSLDAAASTLARIKRIAPPDTTTAASSRVQAVMAARLLNDDDWRAARPLLESIPEERARPLLVAWLERALAGGPRRHVDRPLLVRARLAGFWLPFIAADVAIISGLVIGFATSARSGWIAFAVVLVLAGLASVSLIRSAIDRLNASSVDLSSDLVDDPRTTLDQLLNIGESIDRERRGDATAVEPDQSFGFVSLFRAQIAEFRSRA